SPQQAKSGQRRVHSCVKHRVDSRHAGRPHALNQSQGETRTSAICMACRSHRGFGLGWATVVLLLVSLSFVVACGSPAPSVLPASAQGAGDQSASTTLVVFAAASLMDVLTALQPVVEQAHPGVQVRHDFAGSPELVALIRQGAPADLLASADLATMAPLVEA